MTLLYVADQTHRAKAPESRISPIVERAHADHQPSSTLEVNIMTCLCHDDVRARRWRALVPAATKARHGRVASSAAAAPAAAAVVVARPPPSACEALARRCRLNDALAAVTILLFVSS